MSTSQANHPTEQIVPQQQHQLPLKRQLPFSSMKPPLGDYHQFSSSALDLRLKEPEAIVVKSLPLKRKSEKADLVAESSDWNPSTGYVEAVGIPLQTPVSGKEGKAQKAPRMAKPNRSGSQTPVSNVGSPSGNNLTPIGPCRYDSSLDGILDLNKAADTLEGSLMCQGQGRLMRMLLPYCLISRRKQLLRPTWKLKIQMFCELKKSNCLLMKHSMHINILKLLICILKHLNYTVKTQCTGEIVQLLTLDLRSMAVQYRMHQGLLKLIPNI